jgi:class 3 adenylate cyclase/tetratricopeptide (TPR) repeat protein
MATYPLGGDGVPSKSDPPTSGVAARRCRVTLLFADLCDYTSLTEACDPEEIADLRQRLMEIASSVVTKHHGAVNQFVGDGIQAVFGFPEADEEEVRHAISAALELGERARELEARSVLPGNFHLRMHSGVHSGLVFASSGDPRHGQYQFTGDAVNTAARLCSVAGRGEVIVSESTLRGFESFFETEPVQALSLKGKKQPVAALRVMAGLPAETRFQARSKLGLSPYVGRQAELLALEEALIQAEQGQGKAVCIVGDAGVGKTRLMDELRRMAGRIGLKVLRGSCESYGGMTPLRPFLQVLRELFPLSEAAGAEQRAAEVEQALLQLDEGLRAHLSPLLELLSVRAGPPASKTDGLQPATAISAITALLIAVFAKGPLLLLLDDWQWSDGASVQVLGRLLRALPDQPCLMVVAARSVDADDTILSNTPRLALTPFTEAESMRAAGYLLEGGLPEATLRRVHGRSGGNPLFLEEICGALRQRGWGVDQLEDSVPNTVHSLIRARVEALAPDAARLLGVASVIGNEFSEWLLAEVSGVQDVAATLSSAKLGGLVQPTETAGVFRFKHGLTREVVYETLRVAERRVLHGKVAQALSTHYRELAVSDHYEALALHYAGAREHAQGAKFAELAGDKAAASSALDRAREHYAAALSQLDELKLDDDLQLRWLNIVIKWSAASVYYPAREQLAVLSRASEYAKRLDDDDKLAWVEHWTGWIYYALGGADAAIERLNRSLTLSTKVHDHRLTAQALVSIGQCYAARGRYEPALDYLDRGLEMKRRAPPLGVGAAYALGCRGVLLGDRGDFAAANQHFDEALAIVADTGDALEGSLLGLQCLVKIWHGAWQEAVETAARGRATGERVNGPYVLAMCQATAGYARFRLDRDLDALEGLRRAVDWLERRDIHLFLSFCYGHLALAELQVGRLEAARDYSQRALSRARNGDPLGEAMAQRVLSRIARAKNDFEGARRHQQLARESGERRGSPREAALADLCLGELEEAEGNPKRARQLFEQARNDFEKLTMTAHAAEAAHALSRLQ